MQGQDAVNTAKAFKEALPLTGIVLTKMDGDSRGGAALSVRAITGAPIKFAGTSEKIDGLEVFDAKRHAGRILGMGDIVGLVEEVEKNVDVAAAQKLADKVKAGDSFDLNDFLSQISQMKKMGGLGGLMDKLPSQLSGRAAQLGPADMDRAERDVRRMEGIICSMTPLERRKPELLKATRKRRIASGAGRSGAGGQPSAQPVRADARHDEEDEGRRHDEDDEADGRHEGPRRHALSAAASVIDGSKGSDGSVQSIVSVVALLCALPLVWWLATAGAAGRARSRPDERLDTLAGWPPEPTRILRSSERLAFSTLKLALPGYLILAQVPLARFLTVPKRNSYAEWMRRLGNQCVDFVVCDVTSQVVAVVEVRPPMDQLDDKVKVRLERVARALKAAKIPLHVWNEEKLPTIEAAREKLLPSAPAVPAGMGKKPRRRWRAAATVVGAAEFSEAAFGDAAMIEARMGDAVVEGGPAVDPFADTDRDWSQGEVIEVREPSTTVVVRRARLGHRRAAAGREALTRAQSTSAAANSRARKVCRSASFSPTPTK